MVQVDKWSGRKKPTQKDQAKKKGNELSTNNCKESSFLLSMVSVMQIIPPAKDQKLMFSSTNACSDQNKWLWYLHKLFGDVLQRSLWRMVMIGFRNCKVLKIWILLYVDYYVQWSRFWIGNFKSFSLFKD